MRRTTVEIDEDLLARAKRALGTGTTKGTVEEALRRALADAEQQRAERAERQRDCLQQLGAHIDLDVLAAEDMWR
ncbi:MAG TPA: type II toxin-antitoxin system VapB family antitoxin [Mycobacteriales bacterium]|nr:type II toxin-antitoxin system VapB family antitoxin [Mycobacteriales bacterium]